MAKNSKGAKRSDDFETDDENPVRMQEGAVEGQEGAETAEEVETEAAPVATADAPERRDNTLDVLRNQVRSLQSKREQYLSGVEQINESLATIRTDIDRVLNVPARANGNGNGNDARPRGRGRQQQQQATRGRGRPTRGGKQSGTAVIEGILEKNGGKMQSSELAAAAKKQGILHPHSSYQSLKKRGRIELDGGMVHLRK